MPKVSDEEYRLQVERNRILAKENAALRKSLETAKAGTPVSLRVSKKKAVSVYGLGRYPVTLYKEQWLRLLSARDDITQFIADNSELLAEKGRK